MKVSCPLCGEKVPLKRLVIVQGLFVERRIARVCKGCASMSDEEHQERYEQEYGKPEIEGFGDSCDRYFVRDENREGAVK